MRYYALEKLINLHDDYRKLIKIDQYNLLLVQVAGERYLIESQCPHRGHSFAEADIDAGFVRCPLHGYTFDLDSGIPHKVTEEPCRRLKTFELVYEATEVGVML